MKRLSEEMRPKFFLMEAKKKRSSSISTLVCILLVCCILLTASGVTFAFYTVKELGRLKARLSFDEKILKQLQTRYTYRQARVSKPAWYKSTCYCMYYVCAIQTKMKLNFNRTFDLWKIIFVL